MIDVDDYVLIDHLFPQQIDKLSSHKNRKRIIEAIELHKKLVPVNLKSKSVTLEWLEKELQDFDFYEFLDDHGDIWQEKVKEVLLSAAKKQAEK